MRSSQEPGGSNYDRHFMATCSQTPLSTILPVSSSAYSSEAYSHRIFMVMMLIKGFRVFTRGCNE